MKAQISETAALLSATKTVLGLSESGRVGKAKGHGPNPSVTEEMQAYFSKLKDLVPFMPRNRKLSKLEIIQYVIDYICDLQLALEVHPGAQRASQSPVNRQPLGVIANVPSNTTLTNTCAAQEANHDKLPSHLEEVNTRPVSC